LLVAGIAITLYRQHRLPRDVAFPQDNSGNLSLEIVRVLADVVQQTRRQHKIGSLENISEFSRNVTLKSRYASSNRQHAFQASVFACFTAGSAPLPGLALVQDEI
jgi:hypothetical protein